MRRPSLHAALISLALATPAFAESLAPLPPQLLLVGRVATMDERQPWAEAVAVSGGRIVYVGPRHAAPHGADRTIEVPAGVILPGLVDAHAHLLGLGMALLGLDLNGTSSYEEILERVRVRDSQLAAGKWLLGRGWDQNDWPEKSFPSRLPLDLVCPQRPVLLERVDGHAILVNAAALRIAGITKDTPDPQGGKILRDASGEPTGVLIDNAASLVQLPAPTLEDRIQALSGACKLAVEAGLTGIHDMGNDRETLLAFRQMAERGLLPIRVYALAAAGSPAHEDLIASGPQLELGVDGRLTLRAVKFYADGALGSRGAALEEPYSDDPTNSGLLLTRPEELCREMQRTTAAGLQVAVHAIGDRGNRIVLDCVEKLAKDAVPAHRPRLEHTQVLRLVDIPRLAQLGVIASMQPTHATSDMPWAEDRVGPQRIRGAYVWKSLLESGARLAFGSDFPVESHRPLLGLYAALTRQDAEGRPAGGWYPEQRLDPTAAIRAFTSGAAFASFQEQSLGKIALGLRADLSVLDTDPFTSEPSSLLRARPLYTVVGGQVVFDAGQP